MCTSFTSNRISIRQNCLLTSDYYHTINFRNVILTTYGTIKLLISILNAFVYNLIE